jgi:hypothetical protein
MGRRASRHRQTDAEGTDGDIRFRMKLRQTVKTREWKLDVEQWDYRPDDGRRTYLLNLGQLLRD